MDSVKTGSKRDELGSKRGEEKALVDEGDEVRMDSRDWGSPEGESMRGRPDGGRPDDEGRPDELESRRDRPDGPGRLESRLEESVLMG